MNQVIISIITVVYNDKLGLLKTIESVKKQNYPNLDFVIIDGGSSDGTKQVIENNIGVVSSWVSEPDNGIYDAMNKGLKQAKGDWLFFLNAGDVFHNPEVLQDIFRKNYAFDEYLLLAGSMVYDTGSKFQSYLNNNIFFKNTIHHQAVFYKRSLFAKYGLYNTKYKLLADLEFHQRLFVDNDLSRSVLFIENVISICTDFGQSKVRHNLLRKERFGLIRSWPAYIKHKILNGF